MEREEKVAREEARLARSANAPARALSCFNKNNSDSQS
jgi:hypothetical protein